MAKYASRVQETTTTTGTGSLTLAAATAGHRRLSDVFSVGDYVRYFVADADGVTWESGYGKLGAGNTLDRDFVMESSVGTTLASLTTGTHTVTIGAHPDMAKTAGYLTRPSLSSIPNDVFTTVPIVGQSGGSTGYDTHNVIPDVGGYTDLPIPLWVDKIRVHCHLEIAEHGGAGQRALMLRFMDDGWPTGGMPGLWIPGLTDVTNTHQALEILSPPIPVPNNGTRGCKLAVYQNSGVALDLGGYQFVHVEFVE
jgi:hypothetical protein